MDPLAAVFIFCFVFGIATTLLSFALGALHFGGSGHSVGHGNGHASLGDGHGAAGHGAAGHGAGGHETGGPGGALQHGGHGGATDHGIPTEGHGHAALHEGHLGETSPFNLQTITAFMAFFGGTGWVAYTTGGLAPAIALILATLAGLAGGSVIFWVMVKLFIRSQLFMDPADSQMEGTVARVTVPIRPNGIGEIVFTHNGTRRSEGARSAGGEAIGQGTEVVVVRYEQGLAYVEPWATYAGESSS